MDEIQIIDMFSGCGGMSCGFTLAKTKNIKYKLLGGLDNDPHAIATYRNMLQSVALDQDVKSLLEKQNLKASLELWGYDPKIPLILIGCAPCQGFSSHRKKDDRLDDRNDLIEVFAKVAKTISPDIVIMENVPELLHKKNWHYYSNFKKILEEAGYHVRARLHNVAQFGVPQERFRALIVASKNALLAKMPIPTCEYENFKTVRDAIGSLPELAPGEKSGSDPMHITSKHRASTIEMLKAIPIDGGSRSSLPPELVIDCHKVVDGFRDVYGRLWWDRPSVSITARCRTPSCGRFTHPEQNRGLSVREAALLQSFPPDWIFEGPFDDKYKQIGNAVPPLFAKALAERIDFCWKSESEIFENLDEDIVQPIDRSISSSLAAWKKRVRNRIEK